MPGHSFGSVVLRWVHSGRIGFGGTGVSRADVGVRPTLGDAVTSGHSFGFGGTWTRQRVDVRPTLSNVRVAAE